MIGFEEAYLINPKSLGVKISDEYSDEMLEKVDELFQALTFDSQKERNLSKLRLLNYFIENKHVTEHIPGLIASSAVCMGSKCVVLPKWKDGYKVERVNDNCVISVKRDDEFEQVATVPRDILYIIGEARANAMKSEVEGKLLEGLNENLDDEAIVGMGCVSGLGQ